MLLRSLNYCHVYPLWDTTEMKKGLHFSFKHLSIKLYFTCTEEKKIKGILSLEKDGLTHISREDFPIDLHVEKACLLVEKHEAVSYWSLILSSALGRWRPGGVPSGGPFVGELTKRKEKEPLREDSRPARCFPPSSLVTGLCFSHSSPMHNESLNVGVRESVPRQVDKKSGGPQGREGSRILKEEERTNFFSSTFLRIM